MVSKNKIILANMLSVLAGTLDRVSGTDDMSNEIIQGKVSLSIDDASAISLRNRLVKTEGE